MFGLQLGLLHPLLYIPRFSIFLSIDIRGSSYSLFEELVADCRQRHHRPERAEDACRPCGDHRCAAEKVYPYLKQLGCDKAGFYSYDVLERLFGYHIYNDYAIEQKWQNPKVGDWIPYRQNAPAPASWT